MSTINEFYEMIKNKGICVLPTNDIVKAVKLLTHCIDFSCDFKNGTCRKIREQPDLAERTMYKYGSCCGECKSHIGYLHVVYLDDMKDYFKSWNDETGFFKIGEGCQLPLGLRSGICLKKWCYDEKSTKLENALISLIDFFDFKLE